VTGGSGFIGAHLVARLAQQRRVCILDVHPPTCAPEGIRYVRGSVLDSAAVHEALEDVQEVYHLAALSNMWMPDKADFQAVNCAGTQVMIDAARKRGVARFLHCSTGALLFGRSRKETVITEETITTLDEMPGAYTRSKLLAEQSALQAAAAGFPLVIASPTMPIGPHNGNLTPPNQICCAFSRSACNSISTSRSIWSTCATSPPASFWRCTTVRSGSATSSAARTFL
jgi:dihydroflavonol-4-reductase